MDKDLVVVSRKLANPEFLAKAAESVVKKEQEKARELGEKRAALDAALARLAALAAGGYKEIMLSVKRGHCFDGELTTEVIHKSHPVPPERLFILLRFEDAGNDFIAAFPAGPEYIGHCYS